MTKSNTETTTDEQERAIRAMIDIQWNTNWGPLPAEAEYHVEKAYEQLTKAREIVKEETEA